jgi:hypothetical protein
MVTELGGDAIHREGSDLSNLHSRRDCFITGGWELEDTVEGSLGALLEGIACGCVFAHFWGRFVKVGWKVSSLNQLQWNGRYSRRKILKFAHGPRCDCHVL